MGNKKPVLICGSVAFDTITKFDGHFKDHLLPENIKSLSVSFFVPTMRKEYGGCAGNIAYALNMLGGYAAPVATVGKDSDDYIERMRQLGIATQFIKQIPESFTAQCHITTDLDGNQISAFHPGAMEFSHTNAIENAFCDWAIVAPDSKAGMFEHARKLHELGVKFIFDLGQAMPLFDATELKTMIDLSDALTLNEYEASVVEQRLGMDMRDIANLLDAVVVTMGARGSRLYHDSKMHEITTFAPEAVKDPTGCGDAHRGGLLYGLSNGWSWVESASLANIMGALKIAVEGPQNYWHKKETVNSLLKSVYDIDREIK
ncbi:carbohydrate kinase family protein [Taylorella asinigenitalis]|uniref:Sugar kinase, ribokinase family n=1 Tax=Taylorella asinigenitalis (strain MCE3) TaxID=1008459 RepID=G4QA48_TAYAM|nr:carbohydrate kinase family protein [Taylorella asinigenitalis]AEP37121.1 Sugar kinase, ribokinase family [Taylorella asinigenitalis MCE3]